MHDDRKVSVGGVVPEFGSEVRLAGSSRMIAEALMVRCAASVGLVQQTNLSQEVTLWKISKRLSFGLSMPSVNPVPSCHMLATIRSAPLQGPRKGRQHIGRLE